MEMDKAVLLSIKPKYVDEIFQGKKLYELRKSMPKQVQEGSIMFIYCTYPRKAVEGFCRIDEIIQDSPKNIWDLYSEHLGIGVDEFNEYYLDVKIATALRLSEVRMFSKKYHLEEIRHKVPGFMPPQTYRYISLKDIRDRFAS